MNCRGWSGNVNNDYIARRYVKSRYSRGEEIKNVRRKSNNEHKSKIWNSEIPNIQPFLINSEKGQEEERKASDAPLLTLFHPSFVNQEKVPSITDKELNEMKSEESDDSKKEEESEDSSKTSIDDSNEEIDV